MCQRTLVGRMAAGGPPAKELATNGASGVLISSVCGESQPYPERHNSADPAAQVAPFSGFALAIMRSAGRGASEPRARTISCRSPS